MQDTYIGIVKKAVAMGIPVAMGTDAGTNYNYHGKNAGEIIYMVEQGIMDAKSALAAATKTAAEAIMLEADIGTLEAGKFADFLLLTENPMENIRVLSQPGGIAAVYKGAKKA